MVILGMIQHQIHAGFDIIVGGVAGFAAIGAVDDGMGADGIPVLDPGGLAVGAVVQLHRRYELLSHLFNKALPVAVHIHDNPMFIEPASRLGDKEPNIGPILGPGLKPAGVAGIGEVAIGVGVNVREQHLQRRIIYLTAEVPLLAVGSGT